MDVQGPPYQVETDNEFIVYDEPAGYYVDDAGQHLYAGENFNQQAETEPDKEETTNTRSSSYDYDDTTYDSKYDETWSDDTSTSESSTSDDYTSTPDLSSIRYSSRILFNVFSPGKSRKT